MGIKAVIFDCFGVLYIDPGLLFYDSVAGLSDGTRREAMEVSKQFDYGFITPETHDRQIAELTGLEYDYVRRTIRGAHRLNQVLLDYSQSLRPTLKVAMLSNVGRGGMDSFFTRSEQQRLFDAVVLSSDVGMIKPSTEIFALTAERLGVAPGECIMVDDREDNCAGADAAGMAAVHYTSNRQAISEVEQILS